MNRYDYQSLIVDNPELFEGNEVPFRIVTDIKERAEWQRARREELLRCNAPASWAELGIVLDDPYVLGIRDLVEFASGKRGGYIRIVERAALEGGKGVAVLPFHEKGACFLLLRQYRHATRRWHLEIPRGFGETGITAARQARIELEEELEFSTDHVGDLVDMGEIHPNTGLERGATQLFLAVVTCPEPLPKDTDLDEGISEIVSLSPERMEEHIKTGTITDSFTIAAYTRARLLHLI